MEVNSELAYLKMVRLIREQGFKENSHFYHRGDGGYCYHVNVETASSIYFKCVLFERGCRGRAILRLAGGPFRETGIHNHPASSDFVGERHFRQNVLNQCREARYTTFQEIVDDARRDRRYVFLSLVTARTMCWTMELLLGRRC